MASHLLYVSTKPLDLYPNAPATIAIKKLMISRQLQLYDVIYSQTKTRPRGLALSLVDSIKSIPQLDQLQVLPPQTEESIDAENKAEAYDAPLEEDQPDTDGPTLPPELRPVLQESGLPGPGGDMSTIITDTGDYDHDALDMKNLPDFDPDQDGEAEFYTNDAINAWIKTDQEECAKGAKPILFEKLNIVMKNMPSEGDVEVQSEFIMTCVLKRDNYLKSHYLTKSHLAPPSLSSNLLIYQIPSSANKSDDDFFRMCQSYAYMSMNDSYQRTSCFRLTQKNDPSLPHWLIVQEFRKEMYVDRWWLALKKKEAEYLWRKNGWEGVKVEFFRERG